MRRAKLLRKLSAALGLAALAAASALAQPRPDLALVERIIVERTNDFRREQGLQPVDPDAKLTAAARYFAQYMARTERYGHEADGTEPADRAMRHGYDYCLVAENLSYQYNSADFHTADLAQRYVEGWKNSPGHRKNMVSPHATDTAVAVTRSEKSGRYYAVQMFGRPKSASIEFRIVKSAREPVRYRVAKRGFTLPPGAGMVHQLCAPQEVALEVRRADPHGKVTPRNGERLQVVREPGGLTLRPRG